MGNEQGNELLEKTRPCPACRMLISVKATTCRYCGKDVPPPIGQIRRLTADMLSHDFGQSPYMVTLGHAARDLTEAAGAGELTQALGREKEIGVLLGLLFSEDPKSILIVGEDGVGKTRLVGAVALAATNGMLAGTLPACRILEFNLGIMQNATLQVVNKVNALISLARETPGLVVVIDGAMPLLSPHSGKDREADTLGSSVMAGEVRCIATLTDSEYAKVMEVNPKALRRFEIVRVEPLSEKTTLEVLRHCRPSVEKQYGVGVSEEALQAAVTLTQQFMPGKHLPGKAIDVLGQACSRYKRKAHTRATYPAEWLDEVSMRHLGNKVESHDIKKVITEITSIDIDAAQVEEWSKKLETRLKRMVVGQEAALTQVAQAITQMRLRFHASAGRPAGVLLFVGPPGVGKVHTVRALTYQLLGSYDNLTVLDMASYSQAQALVDLFGSLPGEDGSVETGTMAKAVKEKALAVVAFDSIDRAQSPVLGNLLPMLIRSSIKDSTGHELNFAKCLFILTLNCPVSQASEPLAEMLGRRIPAEMLGSLDAVIRFRAFEAADVRSVIRLAMERFYKRLKPLQVGLKIHEAAYECLMQEGYDPKEGVRKLPDILERRVFDPIGELLQAGKVQHGNNIEVITSNNQVAIQVS